MTTKKRVFTGPIKMSENEAEEMGFRILQELVEDVTQFRDNFETLPIRSLADYTKQMGDFSTRFSEAARGMKLVEKYGIKENDR